jgi:hypothetical protein
MRRRDIRNWPYLRRPAAAATRLSKVSYLLLSQPTSIGKAKGQLVTALFSDLSQSRDVSWNPTDAESVVSIFTSSISSHEAAEYIVWEPLSQHAAQSSPASKKYINKAELHPQKISKLRDAVSRYFNHEAQSP